MPIVNVGEQQLGFGGALYTGECNVPQEALDQWSRSGIAYTLVDPTAPELKDNELKDNESPSDLLSPYKEGLDSNTATVGDPVPPPQGDEQLIPPSAKQQEQEQEQEQLPPPVDPEQPHKRKRS